MRILYFLLFPLVAMAAEPSTTDTSEAKAAIKTRLAETRALLEQDREEAAESRLDRDARSERNSMEWHQGKAADFLRIAFSAKEAGDSPTAQRAARLALVQLDKIERLSSADTATLASISELRGVIRERLLGDTSEAAREYKKALLQKPDSRSARQKLGLLDHSVAFQSLPAQ